MKIFVDRTNTIVRVLVTVVATIALALGVYSLGYWNGYKQGEVDGINQGIFLSSQVIDKVFSTKPMPTPTPDRDF